MFLATPILLYVGGYFVLSKPSLASVMSSPPRMEANYRFGDDVSERLFRPMEFIDRGIRPDFWAERPRLDQGTVPVYEDE